MISFSVITNENKESVISSLSDVLTELELEELCDIIDSFDTEDEDVEFAVTFSCGCLLVRIFDTGRYLFAFPYQISADADVSDAILEISEYAVREEVPLTFTDVPCECLPLFRRFRHLNLDAEDEDGEIYRVRIKNECELLEKIPETTLGRVTLNAILEDDIEDYAKLCKDENVNKYWGYDYRKDVSAPKDSYFYENAALEFSRGVSMCMAIRTGGEFCGEAVIYAFDGRGAAEIAIRLLPGYQGMGLGKEAALAAISAAKKCGLCVLYSRIFSENLPSVALFKSVSDEWSEKDGVYTFTIYLN